MDVAEIAQAALPCLGHVRESAKGVLLPLGGLHFSQILLNEPAEVLDNLVRPVAHSNATSQKLLFEAFHPAVAVGDEVVGEFAG